MSGRTGKVRTYRMAHRADLYALRFDPTRRRWLRRSTGMTTEQAALRVAMDWRREGEAIESGEQPATAALRRLSLAEQTEAFLESKRSNPKQLSATHLADTATCLRRVREASGWTRLSDVTLDGIQAVLGRIAESADIAADPKPRRGRRPSGERMSNSRLNHYRAAWKALTRWAHRTGRLDSDPLAAMDRWRTDGHETFVRRALTVEEFGRLMSTALASGVVVEGRGGRERAMAYLVAASTGLRLSECAALKAGYFEFGGEIAAIKLPPAWTKNRKGGRHPILPDAVEELKRWLAGRDGSERPWAWLTEVDAAVMIRADASAAGIEAGKDAAGEPRQLDFHGLRHTYGTWLTTVLGLHPKAAQRLMRHSTMELTMKLYTHIEDSDLARQMGKGVGIGRCAGVARSGSTTDDHARPDVARNRATGEGVGEGEAVAGDGQASGSEGCEPPNEPPPAEPGAERSRWDLNPRITDLQADNDRTLSPLDAGVVRCADDGAAPALRAGDSTEEEEGEEEPEPPVRARGRRRSARERAEAGEAPSSERAIAKLLSGIRLMGVAS